MLINGAVLAATQVGFRTEFNKAFDLTPTDFEKFAMVVPSTKKSEQYKWLGALPLMKEWLSDAQYEKFSAYSWEIVNKTWQAGIEVDREDIEDDALGMLTPQIQMMGAEAKRHPGQLVFDLLNNGFTAKGYDGQYFFDTDHKDESGPTQVNKVTTVLSATSYQVGRQTMRKLLDQKSRPMALIPTHLLVPPELEATGKTILAAQRLASGADNVNFGTAELVVSPYITSATSWFLLCLDRPIKPFVLQTRRAPEFVAQDRPDDDLAMQAKKFRYQVNARYNAGYGLWQFAYGSTGAG